MDLNNPFRMAADGNLERIKILFRRNPEQFKDVMILYNAIEAGQLEIVQFLIENGAPVNRLNSKSSPLFYASFTGQMKIVEYLIDKGAIIDIPTLNIATQYDHLEIVQYLVEKATVHNISTLRVAAEHGRTKIIKYLVEKGADFKAQDNEILIEAAIYGRTEIIQYLVEKGADVKAQGNLALIKAATYGSFKTVKLLLEYGARDQHYKALHKSIENRLENDDNEAIIKCLLEYFYPREIIEDLLKQVSNSTNIMLLQNYLNQKFLISYQDQRLLNK